MKHFEQAEHTFNSEEIKKQFELPQSKRSVEFQKYVIWKIEEKKKIEKELLNSDEDVPESEIMEKTFARYMKGLALRESDLRNKKIIDAGSGDGEFVAALLEKRITDDAYGFDAMPTGFSENEKYRSHFFTANFEDKPTITDTDYTLSFGAITDCIWGGEETADMKKVFKNLINTIKETGEIRIFPIQISTKENPLPGLEDSYEVWNKLLPQVAKEESIEWNLQPIDIKVVGRDNDVILEEVLVMKKKTKK